MTSHLIGNVKKLPEAIWTHWTHDSFTLRQVVWPLSLSPLNAIVRYFAYVPYVAYISWCLLPHSSRTFTAKMLVFQLADIAGPGTQRHVFHGTSGQLFRKFRQLLHVRLFMGFSWTFHGLFMDLQHENDLINLDCGAARPGLPGRNKDNCSKIVNTEKLLEF